MPTFEPEDFWAALHRLYEQLLKHDEQIAHNSEQIAKNSEQIAQLVEQTRQTDERLSKLVTVVGDVTAIVRSHEQRLEGLEGPA
jgi:methyl-accepting chemotaxis protein